MFIIPAETNQNKPLPRNIKRWHLNDKQYVQTKGNKRITYRQIGGKYYRGISLLPHQFKKLDEHIGNTKLKYFVHDLGGGIYFTHPTANIYTLWKQSKKHPNDDVAFFRFDETSWQHYLNDILCHVRSLVSEADIDDRRHVSEVETE